MNSHRCTSSRARKASRGAAVRTSFPAVSATGVRREPEEPCCGLDDLVKGVPPCWRRAGRHLPTDALTRMRRSLVATGIVQVSALRLGPARAPRMARPRHPFTAAHLPSTAPGVNLGCIDTVPGIKATECPHGVFFGPAVPAPPVKARGVSRNCPLGGRAWTGAVPSARRENRDRTSPHRIPRGQTTPERTTGKRPRAPQEKLAPAGGRGSAVERRESRARGSARGA